MPIPLRSLELGVSVVISEKPDLRITCPGTPYEVYEGRETLVYTRGRVRIPLDRMHEGETVILQFSPKGSERAPEPVSVEWNAPGRDIGDAGGEGHRRSPATLVDKP